MRPLRLEVEGFACYRDRQPALDLTGLSLFAIAGATGSGKSTILDAMLYALFGMVPRVGRQGVVEFVSHGRDVLSVGFDFQLHGKTYRVARSLRKGKRSASTAALGELTPAGERSLADSVTEVDARVKELIGLDFDAFTQTVILPQNQFARFLQSRPKDQRAILQHLLQHAVYERMRAEAARRKDAVERDLRIRTEQLEPVREATPEALQAREAALEQAGTARAIALQARAAAAAQAHDVGVRRQLTLDLEACRATAAALEARAPAIAALEGELVASHHAAAVGPVVDAWEKARQRSLTSGEDVAAAAEALRGLQLALDAAAQRAQAAEEAAGAIGALRVLLRQLDEIRGDAERVPLVVRELALARDRVASASRALDAARAAAGAHKIAHDSASDAATVAQKAVGAVAYDPDRHARLDEQRDAAGRARTLTVHLEDIARRIESSTQQRDKAALKAESCRQAEEVARALVNETRAGRERAEQLRREGSHQHTAEELRRHLVAGEPCPVCAQVVPTVPAGCDVPELAALDAAVARAVAREQAAGEALRVAGRDLAAAGAEAAQQASALRDLRRDLQVKQADLHACLGGLAHVVAASERADATLLLATFDAQLEEAKRASAALRARRDALADAEKAVAATALELAKAEGALRECEQAVAQHQRDLTRLDAERLAIQARIAAVTSAPDPGAERSAAAARIAALEQSVGLAREETARLSRDRAAAQARVESLTQTCDAAQRDVHEQQAVVERALAAHGFVSVAAATAAARTVPQTESLERETREFRDRRASHAARLAELRQAVEGREVDADAVDAAQRRAGETEEAFQGAVAAASRLEAEAAALRRDADRARQLTTEAEALGARLAVTSEMAVDLRSDGFQDYLLEEAFRGLVAGASTRLRQMSRRYTMEWDAGEFYVIDHDNAGERRRAETLSGGETFMASLCLALQLSDEVLHASGALRMDSLFIDEGFGTLDTQSLAEVTDALETLRQDGARVIGVISHRPELTERLPGCIRVDKGVGESTWVLERIG